MPSELEEPTESGSGCKMWIAVLPCCTSPEVDLGHGNCPQRLKNPGKNFSPTTKMRFGARSQNAQEERAKRYSKTFLEHEVTPTAGRRQEVGMRGRKVK